MLLDDEGDILPNERYSDLQLAISAPQHGEGRSYDTLVQKSEALPPRVKQPDKDFLTKDIYPKYHP